MKFPTIIVLFMTFLVVSCGPARRDTPILAVAETPAVLQSGHEAFDHHCSPCHPNGSAGLGPALNNKPLPEALIRRQVRQGLGAMPAFDEEHLSDEHLTRVVAYLRWVRETPVQEQPDTDDGT